MPRKVFLWTAPRCVSTAFERSIMETKDSKIFHEPYARSYHFGPERQSPRYLSTPVDMKASYKEIEKLLTKEYDGIDIIFSKDMAYAVENHFDKLLSTNLLDFQHTFLIRNPRKAIPSLYKASINKQLTGWDYFDPVEAGFKQMYELYHYVKEKLNQDAVIVDADDLLANPVETMAAYCNATNILFDEHMLRWDPGPVHDWDVWNGWHENALKSSGFTKKDPIELNKFEGLESLPKEVQDCMEECMTYYAFFQKIKLKPVVERI